MFTLSLNCAKAIKQEFLKETALGESFGYGNLTNFSCVRKKCKWVLLSQNYLSCPSCLGRWSGAFVNFLRLGRRFLKVTSVFFSSFCRSSPEKSSGISTSLNHLPKKFSGRVWKAFKLDVSRMGWPSRAWVLWGGLLEYLCSGACFDFMVASWTCQELSVCSVFILEVLVSTLCTLRA